MSRPIGLAAPPPIHDTKQRLLAAGLRLMLAHGYHALGIQALLSETGIPKGSFYHHFASKQDFTLQVIDAYQANVHALLAATAGDRSRPPLDRVRAFFAGVRQAYEAEGYLGCFLGALGQELSGTSEAFRRKIDGCLAEIARGLRACLAEACASGDLPPGTDPAQLADVLVNTWEGAALRSRLARDGRPLDGVIDFYLTVATAAR